MAFVKNTMIVKLNAKKRDLKQKARDIRRKGSIPGVLYGAGKHNIPLIIDSVVFKKVFEEAGESTILGVNIEKEKEDYALVEEVKRDPVTDEIVHFDLVRVKMDEDVETSVELEFIGISVAVKDHGGVLVKNMDHVEVKSLPLDLPKNIQVDISVLKTFEDVIKVGDLKKSDKVKILDEKDEIVATVTPPRTEEELKELDETVEEDVEKIEVEEKGKKEEDEEGEEGTEAGEGDEKKGEKGEKTPEKAKDAKGGEKKKDKK